MNQKLQKFRIKRAIARLDEAAKQADELRKQLESCVFLDIEPAPEEVDCPALYQAWQVALGAVQIQQQNIATQQSILIDLVMVEQDLANQYITQCEELD